MPHLFYSCHFPELTYDIEARKSSWFVDEVKHGGKMILLLGDEVVET